MHELIERLEKATGPDVDLDHAIGRVVRPADGHGVLGYTCSIDAALTLVPKGWRVNWAGECPDRTWFFDLIARNKDMAGDRYWGNTAALALCIAALRTRRHSSAITSRDT